MSQALLLRVRSLEERVAELESAMTASIKDPFADTNWAPFHKGGGQFGVRGDNLVEVGTENLSKDEALELARQLNEATEGMAA